MKIFTTSLFILLIALSAAAQPQTPQAEKANIAAGQTFLQNGELDKAIAEFDKAIKLNPNSFEAFYFRGSAKFFKQDVDGAIFDYGKVIELAPKAPGIDVVYNNRGMFLYLKGDGAGALADFEKAIAINANNPSPYVGRGNLLSDKGELDKALTDFEKAIKLDVNIAPAYIGRADILFSKGDLDKALSDYNKVIELTPTSAEAHIERGKIYGLKGNWALAVGDLTKGIEISSQATPNWGNIKVTLSELDAFVAKNPKNANAFAVRGFIKLLQRKDAEADADFNKSFELDPKLKIDLDKFIKEAKPAQK